MRKITVVALMVFVLLTALVYADEDDEWVIILEFLEGTCAACGDFEGLLEPLMFPSETPEQTYDIVLVYRNTTAGGLEERNPVKNALIIVHVKETGEESGDVYRVYTDNDGKALFDFQDYNDSCHEFQFTYCHMTFGCGYEECLNGTGINYDDYPSVMNIPMHPPGASAPSSIVDPIGVQPTSTTTTFCPPPPPIGGVTAPIFCFPLILLFALLGGGLYLSGRNPFRGFDFSAPRLHKPYQYTARIRGTTVSIQGIMQATGVVGKITKAIKKGSGLKKLEKDLKGQSSTGMQYTPSGLIRMAGGAGSEGRKWYQTGSLGQMTGAAVGAFEAGRRTKRAVSGGGIGALGSRTGVRGALAKGMPWLSPMLAKEGSGMTWGQATAQSLSGLAYGSSFGMLFNAIDDFRRTGGAEGKMWDSVFGRMVGFVTGKGAAPMAFDDAVRRLEGLEKGIEVPIKEGKDRVIVKFENGKIVARNAAGEEIDVTAADTPKKVKYAFMDMEEKRQEAFFSITVIGNERIAETQMDLSVTLDGVKYKSADFRKGMKNQQTTAMNAAKEAKQRQVAAQAAGNIAYATAASATESADAAKAAAAEAQTAADTAMKAGNTKKHTAQMTIVQEQTKAAQGFVAAAAESMAEHEKQLGIAQDAGAEMQKQAGLAANYGTLAGQGSPSEAEKKAVLRGIVGNAEQSQVLQEAMKDNAGLREAMGGMDNFMEMQKQAAALALQQEAVTASQHMATEIIMNIDRMKTNGITKDAVDTSNRIGGLTVGEGVKEEGKPGEGVGMAGDILSAFGAAEGLKRQKIIKPEDMTKLRTNTEIGMKVFQYNTEKTRVASMLYNQGMGDLVDNLDQHARFSIVGPQQDIGPERIVKREGEGPARIEYRPRTYTEQTTAAFDDIASGRLSGLMQTLRKAPERERKTPKIVKKIPVVGAIPEIRVADKELQTKIKGVVRNYLSASDADRAQYQTHYSEMLGTVYATVTSPDLQVKGSLQVKGRRGFSKVDRSKIVAVAGAFDKHRKAESDLERTRVRREAVGYPTEISRPPPPPRTPKTASRTRAKGKGRGKKKS